jgi:glycosyltransferase involved in cell wall biosynthesis
VRRESIRAYKLPERNVVSVPSGIPVAEFAALRSQHVAPSKGTPLVVGMVGNLEEHKDQATLIEAIGILVRRDANIRLRLIGSGLREPWLRDRAYHLGISEHVTFTGMVTDVKSELAKLDLFAYAVHQEEGLGIALVEALAAGIPVVASDVGACREVLADGRFGRLVASGDAAEWAAAISAGMKQQPPPIEAAARYDIKATARGYRALLSAQK